MKNGFDMDEIDDILNSDSELNKYVPSENFVDTLMNRIDALELEQAKSISVWFKSAAAVALVFLLANLSVVLFNSNASESTSLMDEWASLYQQNAGQSWFDTEDLEMFASVTTINGNNE